MLGANYANFFNEISEFILSLADLQRFRCANKQTSTANKIEMSQCICYLSVHSEVKVYDLKNKINEVQPKEGRKNLKQTKNALHFKHIRKECSLKSIATECKYAYTHPHHYDFLFDHYIYAVFLCACHFNGM